MPTTIQPYEIIHRYNDGSWSVAARTQTVYEDGTTREGPAVPLSGVTAPVFDEIKQHLTEMVSGLYVDLVVERDGLQADLAAANTAKDEALTAKQQAESQVATLTEQIHTLQNQLAELTAEPEVQVVSRRQARLALLQMNLLQSIEQAVYASPVAVQIEYEADVWRRDNPTLIAMAEQLGMSTETLDQFFQLAGTL